MKNKSIIFITTVVLTGFAVFFLTYCSSNAGQQQEKNAKTPENVIQDEKSTTEQVIEPVKEVETVSVEKASELTDKDFHNTISKGVTLVDFWAAWCAPCRTQGPIVDELAKEMGAKAKITKLNVDNFNAISMEYNVRNIPTIIIFKDGKAVQRYVGVQQKDFLKQQIEQYL